MTTKRQADVVADRLDQIEMFYVIMDKSDKTYFSRDEDWSSDYAAAMRFPSADAARFEMRGIDNSQDYVRVVGPCMEGEEP